MLSKTGVSAVRNCNQHSTADSHFHWHVNLEIYFCTLQCRAFSSVLRYIVDCIKSVSDILLMFLILTAVFIGIGKYKSVSMCVNEV